MLCLTYSYELKKIFVMDCIDDKGKYEWSYKYGQIKNLKLNLCIEITYNLNEIFMNVCNLDNKFQKWYWSKRINK